MVSFIYTERFRGGFGVGWDLNTGSYTERDMNELRKI
jgi:hypothetical protein